MSMNLRADWAVELDAGQAPERLVVVLVSPPSAPDRRELSVYRESENGRTLRIVEATYSGNGTQPSREIERFLDLTQDGVLPLYTIVSQTQLEWNVEVAYGKGTSRVAYTLHERKDAFRLQRLFTGYEPTQYFEGVSCSVIFRSGRVPVLSRDSRYKGYGEIQLWWPEVGRSSVTSLVSPTSSRSSLQGTSLPSTFPGFVRRTSVLSVQINTRNDTNTIISELPPPPVLVAFLKDDNGYTMLKTDITNLENPPPQDGRIDLRGPNGRTFAAERLSVTEPQLGSWNICAFDTKAPEVNQLNCTFITLKFASSMASEEFDRSLLCLRERRLKLEVDRMQAIERMSRGMLPLSPISAPKRNQHSPSTSLPSLPGIPHTGSLHTDVTEGLLELEAERQRQELGGISATGPFEIYSRHDT